MERAFPSAARWSDHGRKLRAAAHSQWPARLAARWRGFSSGYGNTGSCGTKWAGGAGGGIVFLREYRGGGPRARHLYVLRAPFGDKCESRRRRGGRRSFGKSWSDGTRHGATLALGFDGGTGAGERIRYRKTAWK